MSAENLRGTTMLALTFQIGDNHLALDILQVREVVPRVRLQQLVGGPPWLAGLFVYRGRVIPVLDLHKLLGGAAGAGGECPPHLSSRIILVPFPRPNEPGNEQPLLGLLAAQVADIRDFQPRDAGHSTQPTLDRGLGVSQQIHVEGNTIIHLLDLDRLLSLPVRSQLAQLLTGVSA